MKRKTSGLFFILVLAVLATRVVWAQTASTGALEGAVSDQTGAPVPGADVTLTSNAGLSRLAVSADDGRYRFSLLPPGTYELKVALEGFKTVTLTAVEVRITESTLLNVSLEVANAPSETVTVLADSALVQADSSVRGNVIAE